MNDLVAIVRRAFPAYARRALLHGANFYSECLGTLARCFPAVTRTCALRFPEDVSSGADPPEEYALTTN
jgi:hypothetical protein